MITTRSPPSLKLSQFSVSFILACSVSLHSLVLSLFASSELFCFHPSVRSLRSLPSVFFILIACLGPSLRSEAQSHVYSFAATGPPIALLQCLLGAFATLSARIYRWSERSSSLDYRLRLALEPLICPLFGSAAVYLWCHFLFTFALLIRNVFEGNACKLKINWK